ncbi:MAG: ABC transporter permease [Turneriella sp.]|nr:ABC transporter permease [Turneriella sp.]
MANPAFRLFINLIKVCGGFLTVLALIILLTVFLQHLRKGSAEEALMGQRGTAASLAKIQDKPFFTKLGEFIADLPSIAAWKTLRGTQVMPQIGNALGNTALLTGFSLVFSVILGLALLFAGELYPKMQPTLERLASAINTTPIFLVGIFFIWLFAFALRLLPSGGDQDARAFILPGLSIGVKFGCRLFLLLRNYMRELDTKVFILRARAYALTERRIFFHKLMNCLMPFVIFWLIETASLFSGAVIVEALFSIHGLGSLLIFALLQYDIRLIFANLVVIAAIVYLTSILQNVIASRRETITS